MYENTTIKTEKSQRTGNVPGIDVIIQTDTEVPTVRESDPLAS